MTGTTDGTSGDQWGRVAEDGTVYVRTSAGERQVGSWQAGDPEGALAFFRRKYDAIALEIDLLETRVQSGTLSPDDASAASRRERRTVEQAAAVGDLDSLLARLDRLDQRIEQRRAARREERRQQQDDARVAKEAIVAEAEKLAASNDWRHGVGRYRELLDQWKSLSRLDKKSDDELWHRFSGARTTYTRRRKQHFTELGAKREEARQTKEQLVAEAEELADSTDWGRTAGRYRDLMRQWKAAGPAPREHEEPLWNRFRAAQDTFFEARNASLAEQDAELKENLTQKEALLQEAEALVPVRDFRTAREALRGILERWERIGHVPRADVRSVEGRLRAVEDAVKQAERKEWERTNPEARARANDTVTQLRSSIAELEQARDKAAAAGKSDKARQHEEAIAARRTWLEEAEKALEEFSD